MPTERACLMVIEEVLHDAELAETIHDELEGRYVWPHTKVIGFTKR